MRRVGDVGGEIAEPDIVRPASVVADREVAVAVIAVKVLTEMLNVNPARSGPSIGRPWKLIEPAYDAEVEILVNGTLVVLPPGPRDCAPPIKGAHDQAAARTRPVLRVFIKSVRQMKQLVLSPVLLFLSLPGASAQLIVSGKVAVADGGQLPDRVEIQRDCGGAPRTAAYTDRKGEFSFPWSDTAGINGDDASQSAPGGPRGFPGNGIGPDSAPQSRGVGNGPGGSGPVLTGCKLRAAAPGYRSEMVILDRDRASFDSYDVGTIILHRSEDAEVPPVSATSLKAPSAARRAFDKGLEAVGKSRNADAERISKRRFVSILNMPRHGWIWVRRGCNGRPTV